MRPYSTISVILIWLSASFSNIKCSTIENCKAEGQRIPDSTNPNKFHLCHFFKKTNSWHSYPFHCSSNLIFDPATQDCIKSPDGKEKSEIPEKHEIHHTPVSNVPIFNGIARLIRSASGFPAIRQQDGVENSEIILSLASSIKSLAVTVEKLANAQLIQKSGSCLPASSFPPTPAPLPAEPVPVTPQQSLQRLPIYEIFRPVYDEDVNSKPNVHATVPVINVDAVKRQDVNSSVESVQIVHEIPVTNLTPSVTESSTTAAVTESFGTTASTTPEPTKPSSTSSATSTGYASNEDYSASDEQDRIPPHQKYPAPGNNLFDFLFTNIFKRPVPLHQRRPAHTVGLNKNRLPPIFLDQGYESTTARYNSYRPKPNVRVPHPQTQQSYQVRIPLLQQTNSPHHAFPVVEQHVLPGGGKLVNLVSLFNHLSGIGTPVDVAPVGEIHEDSDHFIPVPLPTDAKISTSTTASPLLPSSTPAKVQLLQSEEILKFPPSVSAIKPILSLESDAEEDSSSSRLNDRKPRM